MAAYPAWVIEARAMLDEACGADAERLPFLSDRERLPYITVAAKECLRWRPFIQTGVPHMLAPGDGGSNDFLRRALHGRRFEQPVEGALVFWDW